MPAPRAARMSWLLLNTAEAVEENRVEPLSMVVCDDGAQLARGAAELESLGERLGVPHATEPR